MPSRYYTHALNEPIRSVSYILRHKLLVSCEMCKKLKEKDGSVLLNNIPVRFDTLVYPGDVLNADLSDLDNPLPVKPSEVMADIVYRDDWFLIANKPAGLITHATTFHPTEDNMERRIVAVLGTGSVFHAVNRLDRYTSGLMSVALCGYMHNLLKMQLHTDDFKRYYLCICCGHPIKDEGTVCLPIGREAGSVIKRCIAEDGAPSFTRYRVISNGEKYSLILCLPLTGRTHQIRLHMKSIGCPLLGDFLYGEEIPGVRCMLHSFETDLTHPITGDKLKCRGELPFDFSEELINDRISLNIPEDISL